jgi:hypothetical protein
MALTATQLFDDATTREIGGIGPDQVNAIVSDLTGVQQQLSAAVPQINNLSDLQTHIIINQLNEEIASVQNANSPTGTLILGTDLGQYVGRAINDIHRDIIDIAQGDAGVQALFNPTPLPALNTRAFSPNGSRTAIILGRQRSRSRTTASRATLRDSSSKLRLSQATPTRSTSRKAACGRRASGTSCGRMAPLGRRRVRWSRACRPTTPVRSMPRRSSSPPMRPTWRATT